MKVECHFRGGPKDCIPENPFEPRHEHCVETEGKVHPALHFAQFNPQLFQHQVLDGPVPIKYHAYHLDTKYVASDGSLTSAWYDYKGLR